MTDDYIGQASSILESSKMPHLVVHIGDRNEPDQFDVRHIYRARDAKDARRLINILEGHIIPKLKQDHDELLRDEQS